MIMGLLELLSLSAFLSFVFVLCAIVSNAGV